jgi:8-oxo-dGTP diphosphatase
MTNQTRPIQVTAAVILQNGRVVVGRRPEGARHGGHWEFPGGKQEDGESLRECLIREIKEELVIDIRVTGHCLSIHHDYGDSSIILHAFYCLPEGDGLLSLQGDDLMVIPVADLVHFDLLPPDREIAQLLNHRYHYGVNC